MSIFDFRIWFLILVTSTGAFGQDSYRLTDDNLRLDLIHSDSEAFYISMEMDTRGNLYVGGRDGVYLFEADGAGFKPRKTIATLPNDTWAYSLQVVGDDLYLLTVTALYRLPGVVRNPKNVKFERVVWGLPLGHIHQGFHGMKVGPDGEIYIAFGDPQPGIFRNKTNPGHLWHWTFLSGPDSQKLPWTGVGGVIRYNTQTHNLNVVSRGYRNICDLDFDEYWNLFGNDNDQEGSALHTFGRLIHVTEGSHYQWSRGWLGVKEPYRNDLIKTITPDLGRFVPFGTCYYNEVHLGDAYKRSLYVARWGSRELGQFPLLPSGASFESHQKTLIVGQGTARPIATFTGNAGRLFVSVCFMERNEKSPVKRTDLVMISNPQNIIAIHTYDPSAASVGDLLDEIESSSWKRRFNAHREIIARGHTNNKQIAQRFLNCSTSNTAWHTLAWLAGQSNDPRVLNVLRGALTSSDTQVAITAADILRRFHTLNANQIKTLLAAPTPGALLAGLRSLNDTDDLGDLADTILDLANNQDSHVRQLAMRIVARTQSYPQLTKRFDTGDVAQQQLALATTMWKWADSIETQPIPPNLKLSNAPKPSLEGFGYVDNPNANLQTESQSHGFEVGGLSLLDWWRQTHDSNEGVTPLAAMINSAIQSDNNNLRKTAGVFANTLGMNHLAKLTPDIAQNRSAKATLVEGAKLSANKAMPDTYQAIDWSQAWKQGKAGVGAKLFKERCIACHDSGDTGQGGGVIGPSLAGVANRFTPQYLAESVVVPSKDVSPNFQTWSVTTKKNQAFMGFLSGEDQNRLTLQLMDGSLKAIEKTTIQSKSSSETSLMPIGLITGPDELKHIVRYLMTLKTGDTATTSQSQNNKKKFIDLLASGDLKDHFDTTGNWTLTKDGVAHLQPREGEVDWKRYGDYLWLKQPYQDFECEFEYKHEPKGNSGFYFNVTDRQNAVGSVIEIQIRDSSKIKELTAHAISGGILPGIDPKANTAKPAGQWNKMKVRSLNGVVAVTLNGKLVNLVRLTHPKLKTKPKQGFIGFQDHGIPFWLRNVRIRNLAATTSDRKTSPSTTKPTAANLKGRPNVVLIFSDDMGYSDLPKFGKSEIPTPNLDRLADEGVLFTDAYVTAPICVASRMGLMSGQHQQRYGFYGNLYGVEKNRLFLAEKSLLPAVFQRAGYRTALVGKWHLSGNGGPTWEIPGPLTRGFDECVAIRGGGSTFWSGVNIIRQDKREKSQEYLTDFWGTEASAFIDRNAKQPFFLYLAFNAVHAPMHALDADQDQFPNIADKNRRIYDGMLLAMDRNIGRVLDRLDENGIADNTIVVFLNDNGGGGNNSQYATHSRNFANNKPLTGHKFDVFEGGIRVPMLMRWPGRVPAGKVYPKMVSSMDVYPTLVGSAGLDMPADKHTDGVNLLPYINGTDTSKPHEWLCWQNRSWIPTTPDGPTRPQHKVHNSAIRKGDWKLVRLNEKIDSEALPPAWKLFDLATDIGEQNDVADRHENIVNEMNNLFKTWRSSMHPTFE